MVFPEPMARQPKLEGIVAQTWATGALRSCWLDSHWCFQDRKQINIPLGVITRPFRGFDERSRDKANIYGVLVFQLAYQHEHDIYKKKSLAMNPNQAPLGMATDVATDSAKLRQIIHHSWCLALMYVQINVDVEDVNKMFPIYVLWDLAISEIEGHSMTRALSLEVAFQPWFRLWMFDVNMAVAPDRHSGIQASKQRPWLHESAFCSCCADGPSMRYSVFQHLSLVLDINHY